VYFADTEWELEAAQRLLPGISNADIARAARDYFDSGDLTIFVTAPDSEIASLPSQSSILNMVNQTRRARLSPPVSEAVLGDLLTRAPNPRTIVSEGIDSETGSVLWTLSNGAKVILKETSNRNNEIILNAVALGGTTSVPLNQDVSARLAPEMLSVSGIGQYSLQDLRRILTGKEVSVSFWASNFHRGIQGSSTVDDLLSFFELLHLYFTEPRFESGAIEAMMAQLRTTLIQRRENPDSYFSLGLMRTIYGNNTRFTPLQVEDLDRVNPNDAFNFIQRSSNPSDYTFVFSGNINTSDFRKYIETYVASIPRRQESFNTLQAVPVVRPEGIERNVYRGIEDRSLVYIVRHAPMPYSESTIATASVLREYLNIRLIEEIREKLGGVYSISASVSFNPFIQNGEMTMAVYFGTNPSRVEELSIAVEAELRRTMFDTIDQEIFDKAVLAVRQTWEISIQSNNQISQSFANSAVIYNSPLSRMQNQAVLNAAVTPSAIQELGRTMLSHAPVRMALFPVRE
jgi:zinc protease